jgi:DNA (cytosine-5)-methyltransferase 1
MRHLDLFSGIGGFALGLEATQKIKTVAFCEIDKYCTKVLNKNWPEVPVYKDIKELTYDKLKADGIDSIDIITGGYPCQPFSIAGNKKGVEDPRHLWPEYFRLIKECRPTWIIGENVSGHIKLGLDAVQEDLESQGYSLRTFSVSASSIGANHQRERIWTVAYSQRNYDSQQIKRVNGEEISLQKEHRENDSTTRNSSGASAIRETRNEHADVEDARRRSWREQFTWNTESIGRGTSEKTEWSTNTDTSPGPSERTETMANAESIESNVGEDIQHTSTGNGQGQTGRESGDVANTSAHRSFNEQERNTRSLDNQSKEEERRERSESSIRTETRSTGTKTWWDTEPDVGRVADGIPDRTHRLKSLGNAVVPQIPYYIAQSILEVMDA